MSPRHSPPTGLGSAMGGFANISTTFLPRKPLAVAGTLAIGVVVLLILRQIFFPAGDLLRRFYSPEMAVRRFVDLINQSNDEQAVDFICTNGIGAAVPKLSKNVITRTTFQTISDDGSVAEVRLTAVIKKSNEYGTVLITPSMTIRTLKENDVWCIDGFSFVTGAYEWLSDGFTQLMDTMETEIK